MPNSVPVASKDAPQWLTPFPVTTQQQNEHTNKLLAALVDQKLVPARSPEKASAPDAYEDLMRDLPRFSYEQDDESTFDLWFTRYGAVIDDRGSSLTDDRKRSLIIDKLNKKKFEKACMKVVDSESLKCLVFVVGLTDASHSGMRLRVLNKTNHLKESDPIPILDDFINECETYFAVGQPHYGDKRDKCCTATEANKEAESSKTCES
ncbi:hypothetical protein GCK32_005781 [Trichostrongylus colubriformis]|uniref:DUF7083 domain-containing protein n=1 Tax=Trichostrongylus colubriformis TaxID=6319 RepID=A0AAN8FLW8_TRICO